MLEPGREIQRKYFSSHLAALAVLIPDSSVQNDTFLLVRTMTFKLNDELKIVGENGAGFTLTRHVENFSFFPMCALHECGLA